MHFYPGFTLTVVITCVGARASTVNIICNSRNIIILFGKHRLQLLRKRSETICRSIMLYQFHFQLHTNYKFQFHLKHTDSNYQFHVETKVCEQSNCRHTMCQQITIYFRAALFNLCILWYTMTNKYDICFNLAVRIKYCNPF